MANEPYQDEKAKATASAGLYNQANKQPYPYVLGELHQKREYLIRQLIDVLMQLAELDSN